MVQFYMLSVILNLLLGSLLFFQKDKDEGMEEDVEVDSEGGIDNKAIGNSFKSLLFILSNKNVKFALGIVSVFIGLLKLPFTMDGIIVAGDLLPALSGIAIGSIVLIDLFKASTQVSSNLINKIDEKILIHKKYFGIAGMGIGILHFLLPGIPLL